MSKKPILLIIFLGLFFSLIEFDLTIGRANESLDPTQIYFINIRQDTSYGLPYGGAHFAGVSSIVSGATDPNLTITITLFRVGGEIVTRTAISDTDGFFIVSMDRLIEDGDQIRVSDGTIERIVLVPIMTYQVDTIQKEISGTAPINILSTIPGSPHSLQIHIGGRTRQITTDSLGNFLADFSESTYLAGLLGSMQYTTSAGDNVFKPIFATDPLQRGELGDLRADIVLGQPDFSMITFNEVVGDRLFNPFGLYVDRSSEPNRVYINDAGNSRVLGYSHLGVCLSGPNVGDACSVESDCPNSSCEIEEGRTPDLVIGQSTFNTSRCNSDSGYQYYPDVPLASSTSLCLQLEEAISPSEGGGGMTMASDMDGNLYIPDIFNNRVLRYDDLFNSDKSADFVWGQVDFQGIFCNQGAGLGKPNSKSLCISPEPGPGNLRAGVALDSEGNLWVADNNNNRVLRFPYNPTIGRPDQEADLVLGQPDFSTATSGNNLNQMHSPASVRVDNSSIVYVTDYDNNRVLVFDPPFSNGMLATRLLDDDFLYPMGLELDNDGGIWVNDSGHARFAKYIDGLLVAEFTVNDVFGGLGVDEDGNIISTRSGYAQDVARYSGSSYEQDAIILGADSGAIFNKTGPHGFLDIAGIEIAAGQLIASDVARLLFWNNVWELSNYKEADGVIGMPDLNTQSKWGPWYRRMRADNNGYLWVLHGGGGSGEIYGFELPLRTNQSPTYTITSPIPLQGGGEFSWTESGIIFSGIEYQSSCDCLWLSDTDNNRVFRIRNIRSNPSVDIVLGQKSINGIHCNQGRDSDDGYIHPIHPSQDSLCHPGGLAMDKDGNLFVADHNAEIAGNWRLMEWDASLLPENPSSVIFGIPASNVLGRNGSFTEPYCQPVEEDPLCGPSEPAFDSQGRMVLGFNTYLGSRFPMLYQDPLMNPFPIGALGDLYSWPATFRFDRFDNLYAIDSNRSKIMIYKNQEVNTFSVSGNIHTGTGLPIPDVLVGVVGYASSSNTDPSGSFTLSGFVPDTYTIVPSKEGYIFSPETRTIAVSGNLTGQDFIGYQSGYLIFLPVVNKPD